jgi:hypothetical protein
LSANGFPPSRPPIRKGSPISSELALVLPQRLQVHTVRCRSAFQPLCHWCLRTRLGRTGPYDLAGTFGSGTVERTCTVPAGRALFFPIVNAFFAAEPPERENAAAALTDASGTAEIDGTIVQNLSKESKYFVNPLTSPLFDLTLPENNVFGAPAGTYSAAAAGGIYLMLAPLSPGEHEIHFEGFANPQVMTPQPSTSPITLL